MALRASRRVTHHMTPSSPPQTVFQRRRGRPHIFISGLQMREEPRAGFDMSQGRTEGNQCHEVMAARPQPTFSAHRSLQMDRLHT
uniref:Uncharacterized protein n=1 Tax=Knipowitschia caucasica TaxID=637954 RepID=A0AAV2LYV5_KNICA